ncbi:MAG: hypothetical protein O2U62_06745 [Candidatus Bathyarchaeota archaeon]|nr:hypothetical protein [Candidatus Bathyarchaeota archaeon]
MTKEKVIKGLLSFGLTRDEAEAYFFLLRAGACRAGDLARKLGINRMKAYRILKALGERGAVEAIVGRPVRFVAVPVEKVINQLIEGEKLKILGMEKNRKEIIQYWRDIQSTVEAMEEPRFRILQGRKQIYEFLLQMFKRAKAKIDIMTTRNDLQRLSYYGIDDKLKSLDQLDKRILTQINHHKPETLENYFDFAEARHVALPASIRFVIVDDTEVLSTFAMDDSMSMSTQKDTGLWTNARNYVQAMKTFFDSLWGVAIDAREVLNAVKAGKAPEEMRVIGTREEYNETFRNMVESSDEEVIIMTLKQLEGIPLAITDLQAASNRGARIKLLTRVQLDSFSNINQLSKCAQVRHNARAPDLQLLIVDRREVLINITHPKILGYSTWSNLKPQIQTMIQVFEGNWIDGVPAQKVLQKLATKHKLTEGLKLAKKYLQESGWIVDVPGQITSEMGTKSLFSLVAKHREQPIGPLVLDLLVEEDALGTLAKLNAKAMDVKPALQILASTKPFYKEESMLPDLYGIKVIYSMNPKELATKIANEANRILGEINLR